MILENLNGGFLYSDESGSWQTRESWEEMYGSKRWREVFQGGRPNHVQEHGYTRTNVSETIYSADVNDMQWSRVFETDMAINELLFSAKTKMVEILSETDSMIIGRIEDISVLANRDGIPSGLRNTVLAGIVVYEFKDGRYKVTVRNLSYKRTAEISSSIYIGWGVSVGAEETNFYESIYKLFYYINGSMHGMPVTDALWYKLANCIDFNLCTSLRLSAIVPPTEEDW